MTQAQTVLLEVKQYHGRVKNYINGQWVDSTTKEWLDVTNPATGGVIAEVPLSTEEEVRQQAGDLIARSDVLLPSSVEWRDYWREDAAQQDISTVKVSR